MKTRVNHLLPLIRQQLEDFHQGELDDAKRAMAEEILKCVREEYLQKANGGPGIDGSVWEPTKRFLKEGGEMLIRTGNLINSFDFELTPTGFKIFTDVVYARRQLSQRLPWPEDQLPPQWISRMLQAGRPYLVRAVANAVKNALEKTGQTVVSERIT